MSEDGAAAGREKRPGAPGWLRAWSRIVLWKRVMGGLALGLLVGLVLRALLGPETAGAFATTWLRPFGDLFVQLIRMLVVPLIFTTLVAGVLAMGEPARLGSIGVRAIGLFLLTSVPAVVIGIGLGVLLQPGAGISFAGVTPGPAEAEVQSVVQRLIAIIPANPFAALSSGDVLAVIFFAILLGVALLVMGDKGKPVGDVISAGADAMMTITHWVMQVAPFGVFFLIAWVAAANGLAAFTAVAMLALGVYAGCLLHMTVVYGGIVRLLGLPALPLFRGMADAQAVAFSTSSSSATLPVTMACVRNNLGVSNSVTSSVVPLGATINMDGTTLYLGLLAIFAAQAFGIPLDFAGYLLVALTATLAAIGAAGIPSASLFLLATVLSGIGATPEQVALMVGFILPFDRPLDMMRTMTNVTGDGAVSVAVAKWEGELDEARYRAPPAV